MFIQNFNRKKANLGESWVTNGITRENFVIDFFNSNLTSDSYPNRTPSTESNVELMLGILDKLLFSFLRNSRDKGESKMTVLSESISNPIELKFETSLSSTSAVIDLFTIRL